MKKDIRSYGYTELKKEMEHLGEKAFRAKQVYEWLHVKLADSFDEMTNLSLKLRERMKEEYEIFPVVMEERQISIDGQRFSLPSPFLVLATQNPVESESTFRLPAAQMDRFLIRISMGYPQPEEERQMLRSLGDEIPFDTVRAVTNDAELVEAQRQIAGIYLSDSVADYIVALADRTRSHPQLMMGASPRATRGLYRAAKAWAAMEGRDYVTPDDVKFLAHPVLEHRLILKSSARFSGKTSSKVLEEVLAQTEASPSLDTLDHEG